MSSSGTIELAQIWAMLDECAPGNTSVVSGKNQRVASSRAMQRRLNVQDSDATLFVLRHDSEPMKFIVDTCRAQRKPAKQLLLHEGVGAGAVIEELKAWIEERGIYILNVVGDASETDAYQLIIDLVNELGCSMELWQPIHDPTDWWAFIEGWRRLSKIIYDRHSLDTLYRVTIS